MLGLAGVVVLAVGLRSGDAVIPVSAAAAPTVPGTGAPTSPPRWSSRARADAECDADRAAHAVVVGAAGDPVGRPRLSLLGLTPRRGAIDPPLLTAGYWIEPYAAPVGSADQAVSTLYVAAHSAGRGDDGFDPLLTADS